MKLKYKNTLRCSLTPTPAMFPLLSIKILKKMKLIFKNRPTPAMCLLVVKSLKNRNSHHCIGHWGHMVTGVSHQFQFHNHLWHSLWSYNFEMLDSCEHANFPHSKNVPKRFFTSRLITSKDKTMRTQPSSISIHLPKRRPTIAMHNGPAVN